ncbi:MAG: hypothetical protein AB9846_11040 [Tenuifilaceae bacterium]
MVKTWMQFAENVKDSNPMQSSLLKSHSPTLSNDFEINVVFESNFMIDQFLEIKSELLLYLRNQLRSKMLMIAETFVEQQSQNSRPYTVEDKFKFMIQKNPSLAKLKQNLNLDFS